MTSLGPALTGTLTVAALAATAVLFGHGSPTGPRTQAANGGQHDTQRADRNHVYGAEGALVIDARSKELTTKVADAHDGSRITAFRYSPEGPPVAGGAGASERHRGGRPVRQLEHGRRRRWLPRQHESRTARAQGDARASGQAVRMTV